MFKLKSSFAGLNKNIYLLTAASLFSDVATEMLYPIFPIFLMQTLHASGSIIGLIEGIAQATQNIIQIFSGWLSDQLNKKKQIALVGYFLAAISKPFMGLSVIWQTALGARFIDRLGTGIRSAPRDGLIAASVEQRHRGKAFGLEGFGDNLGACLGPIITILIIAFLHPPLRTLFYIAVVPGLFAFLCVLFVKESKRTTMRMNKFNLKLEHFPKNYWKYMFCTALFGIGNSSNVFLILQMQSIDVSIKTTILIYAFFNLIAALVSYPAGYLSDLIGRKKLLITAFLIFFLTYLGFALVNYFYFIAMLFILYGIYQGISRAVGKALAIDFSPTGREATGIGFYSMTSGLLQLLASIVAGLLWDHVGHSAVFIYGAVFSFVSIIAFVFLLPKTP